MKYIGFLICTLVFVGCGYKSTLAYVKQQYNGKIYIEVPVDIGNISNSILLKEALSDIFANKFNLNIVSTKNQANIIVTGKILSIGESQIESENGFSRTYRESVSLQIISSGTGIGTKSFILNDFNDFVIDNNSLISQRKKDEAIGIAIRNALLSLPSQIAVTSYAK